MKITRRKAIAASRIRGGLNEKDYKLARPNTTRLWDMVDEGLLNVEELLDAFTKYVSDDDVGEILRDFGVPDEEDDEDEEY